MHYVRFWRNGTYDLIRKTTGIVKHSGGYIRKRSPSHKLADCNGYVFEHRFVYFEANGYEDLKCAICGKTEKLDTCHIDHIDENKTNNNLNNLRLTCMQCNIARTPYRNKKNARNLFAIGELKTITEWAADPRVKIHMSTISNRLDSGMSDHDALFSKKLTHNGNQAK